MSRRLPHRRVAALAAAAAVLALAPAAPAAARGGDDDVRVSGTCGGGIASELRLRADDGAIRVEFELDGDRRGRRWRVVLVHERRVEWRGRARTRGGNGGFRIRRSVADLDGADEVSVRASGPGGNSCLATATLPGA